MHEAYDLLYSGPVWPGLIISMKEGAGLESLQDLSQNGSILMIIADGGTALFFR